MAQKPDHTIPKAIKSPTIPTLSFSFLKMFKVDATGSVGVAVGAVLGVLGMAAVLTLVIAGPYYGLDLSWLGKLVSPLIPYHK